MKRVIMLILAAAVGMALAGPGLARSYPASPVTVIVPFAPGGSTDIIARRVFAQVGKDLNQQFLIENRAGAGGTIGAAQAAQAKPDGSTLLFYSINISFAEALYPKLTFSPSKDLVPIAMVARAPNIMAVPANSPYKTAADLIAAAKAKPGGLSFASTGVGAANHLAVAQFERLTGTRFTHVPYTGGGPASVALMAGETDFMIESAGSLMAHVQGGKLRALATTGGQRLVALPDVPTMQEAGVGDFVYYTWFGMWGPAGVSQEVVKTINAAVNKALADPTVIEGLALFAVEPAPETTEQFAAFVTSEIARWGTLIREANIAAN